MSLQSFYSYKSHDGRVSEYDFNRLVDLVQSTALAQGVGYKITRTPAGTTLRVKPGAGGAGPEICPFECSVKSVGSNLIVKVSPGAINNLVPTNMFNAFTVASGSAHIYVKAAVVSDGQKVTSSALTVDTTAPIPQVPVPSALPAAVDVLLAIVKDGKPYKVISCGSVYLQGQEQFRVGKDAAEPGQLAYTPYYIWGQSTV